MPGAYDITQRTRGSKYRRRFRKGRELRRKRLRKALPKRNPNSLSVGLALLPRRKWVDCVYETNFVGTKANGATCGFGLIRCNSIYDPEYTNLGKNKPVQGFATIQSLYNKYKVYGMKAYIEVVNGSSKACILGFTTQNDLTSTGTTDKVTDIGTRKGGKTIMLGYMTENRKIQYNVDIKKIEGLKESQFIDDDYASIPNGNPTRQVYLCYSIGQIGELTTEALSIYYKIRLVYKVLLFDPIEVTDST